MRKKNRMSKETKIALWNICEAIVILTNITAVCMSDNIVTTALFGLQSLAIIAILIFDSEWEE